MASIEVVAQSVDIGAEFGVVPYGIESSARISEITSKLANKDLLIADFVGVEDVTESFLEAMWHGRLDALFKGEWSMLALVGMNNTVRDAALWHRRDFVAAVDGEAVLLASGYYRKRDFEAAKRLSTQEGAFTSSDIAKELGIGRGTARERLHYLTAPGAVTRELTGPAAQCQYLYRSITDSDLAS